MRGGEIDREGRLWTIGGDRTKNHRPHEVPLSDAALSIIEKRGDWKGLLFGRGEGSFSGWSGAKEALDARIREARANGAGKDLVPWVLHDVRRTLSTRMHEAKSDGGLGIQPHVVEAVLNHVSGHRSGVAGVYNRALYRNEKRQALDLWAAHVEALIQGRQTNIVPLRVAT
jgi:integrase